MIEHWHIDFETFSHQVLGGVKGVGSYRYAEDETTEPLCLAYAPREDDPRIWVPDDAIEQIQRAVNESRDWMAENYWRPRKQKQVPAHQRLYDTGRKFLGLLSPAHGGEPIQLFDAIKRGALIWAWNAEFEMAVWELVMVNRWGWPPIPFDQWRDTEANAMSLAFPPALGMTGAALGLDTTKDKRGKQLLTKLATPRKPSEKNPATRWTPYSAAQDFIDLYAYCYQDVRSEAAIHEALPIDDLSPEELENWQSTVRMNWRGWTIDEESVRLIVDLLEQNSRVTLKELWRLTAGAITTAGQLERMKKWLAERGVIMPNFQVDTVTEALKRDDIPANARRLLEIRAEMGLSSIKKYHKMLAKLCQDGTVKNNIMYHGASTGRDVGRGIQPQNFVRKKISKNQNAVEDAFRALRTQRALNTITMLYGDVPHFASSLLRPNLVARPGHHLYTADFGQIELRVGYWYADDEFGINTFEQKLDPYKMLAVEIFGAAYQDVTDDRRQICKPIELGCIYQMGGKTLKSNAEEQFSVLMTLEESTGYVQVFRDSHPGVVKLWAGLNKAAKRAVRTGMPRTYGRVTFEVRGDFLYMKLASGREIAYYHPRVQQVLAPWGEMIPAVTYMTRNGYTKKWERATLTPGTMTNNVVQGTSRDLMMIGAHNVEAHNFPLVGRVHDELVSEAPVGFGTVEQYEGLMCPDIPWLQGIPIIAEGWVGQRYRK